MGLIIDLSGEPRKTEAGQANLSVAIKAVELAPKQNFCPVILPDAELLSRDLKYLNGISEDLTGWTLWKRIEQGKECRWATDPAGVIRWKLVYTQTAILNIG